MPGRRGVSFALALVVAAVAALPLVAVCEAEDQRCCRRGVCCHRARPSDDACVRSLCRCAAHGEAGDAVPVGWLAAVLPVASAPAVLVLAGTIRVSRPTPLRTWQPEVPHPPPQSDRSC